MQKLSFMGSLSRYSMVHANSCRFQNLLKLLNAFHNFSLIIDWASGNLFIHIGDGIREEEKSEEVKFV